MKSIREIKGSDLTDNQLIYSAQNAVEMLNARNGISIRTITVKKPNVEEQSHFWCQVISGI
ncbi:MAG: hypothetical protein ACRENO_01615 [Thermodesulfobacteriota bacterium]